MLSQVCASVLLVTLGCTVGEGSLCCSAELEASRETACRATIQSCSNSLLTQESGSGISGEELGFVQDGQQPEQPESKNCKQVPTVSEEYACPLPWSGHTWSGNSIKSFDVNSVLIQSFCTEVQVGGGCFFEWSRKCATNISSCLICRPLATYTRTECNEERILVRELHPTDTRYLSSNLGYISPVPRGLKYYSPNKEIVWQLQAMEGHRVYLELSQLDFHNKDSNCSDYIEISFDPCTAPTKICDNRVNSYKWTTSQTRVQVRFVSDRCKPTNGSGFRGAYYYYPVNTSNSLEDALKLLRQTSGRYSAEEPDDKQHQSGMECC